MADEQDEPTDIEILAKETGWAPRDDWRGDEDAWVDAQDFIRQGQKNLKSTLAKQDQQLVGMKALEGTVDEFRSHLENVEKRSYAKAKKDLEALQREAVEEGDTDIYDSVQTQIEDLDKEIVDSAPKKAENKPASDPNFDSWSSEDGNKWYNDDIFLTGKADAEIAPTVAKMFPTLVGTRGFYDKISEEIRKQYPERFGKSSRTRAASVEGAGTGGDKPSEGKKTFADLPQDAKDACERFIENKIIKDRDTYVSTYDWDGV